MPKLKLSPLMHVQMAVKWRKLAYLAVGWWLAGSALVLLEYFFLNKYGFWQFNTPSLWAIWLDSMTKVLIGISTIGVAEVFYFKDRFSKHPFGRAIFTKSLYYTLAIILITGLVDIEFAPAEFSFWERVRHWCWFGLPLNLLTWGPVVVATLMLLLIRDKYGHGVFSAFIRGYYHTPREEYRIFMFLDLNNSTSIAEKLGHVQYFNLLKSIFADVTYPILHHKGEVYQYVGDEVVVSWKVKNGLTHNNAVQVFFDIQRTFQRKTAHYIQHFGLVPQFKASLHYGEVTVGEIGVIKKDIVFTGDTLNTASRIRDLCNQLQSPLLVSGELVGLMDLQQNFQVEEIGKLPVKGRMEPVHLFRVGRNIKEKPISPNISASQHSTEKS